MSLILNFCLILDWHGTNNGGCEPEAGVRRQLSVSSDSKLLDDPCMDGNDVSTVILRQKRPPRPKSEVFLSKDQRRSKRYSAFGVSLNS